MTTITLSDEAGEVFQEAKAAYERRRKDQLNRQETLGNW